MSAAVCGFLMHLQLRPLQSLPEQNLQMFVFPIKTSSPMRIFVTCCFCFRTMTRTGGMLSKCGFTWAIKQAVLLLFCNDTSVDAAFKGICLFLELYLLKRCSVLVHHFSISVHHFSPFFLTKFLTLACQDHFLFNIFVFSWNQIPSLAMMVLFGFTCSIHTCCWAVSCYKSTTFAGLPGAPSHSRSVCSSSSHRLDQVGFVISSISSEVMWGVKAACCWQHSGIK